MADDFGHVGGVRKGVSEWGCTPSEGGKFCTLKLVSYNLVNTFGHKFRAGYDE